MLKPSGASWLVNTLQESNINWFRETAQRLCIYNPLGPCPLSLFIWLVLIYIIYNKSVIKSIALSWILWICLANCRTWGGLWPPEFVSSWKEVHETWGSLKCSRCLKWGYSCWRPCGFTCGIWHRLNQVVSVRITHSITSGDTVVAQKS